MMIMMIDMRERSGEEEEEEDGREREGGQTVSKRIRVLWPVSTCSDGLTSTIVGLSTVQTTRQNEYFSFRTDQPCWLTFHHS